MTKKFLFSLAIFIPVVYAYFQVDWAVDQLRQHAPNPTALIDHNGVAKRQIDFYCIDVLNREDVSPLRRGLVCRYYHQLTPLLYIIAALTGWCASVWLLAFRAQADDLREGVSAFLMSLLLAFVAGLASYLIVRLALTAAPDVEAADLMSRFAILPLLAGTFSRVFFAELPRLLQKLLSVLGATDSAAKPRNTTHVMVWIALLVPLSSGVAGTYYRCADPKDKCVALTDEEKAGCPECKRWQQAVVDTQRIIDEARQLQREAGIRTSGIASNFFIAAASDEIHKIPIASETAFPPTTRQLRTNPEKYGLEEISIADVGLGSIVLFDNFGGIVVSKNDDDIKVAYSSAKLGGELNVESISVLEQIADPIFVQPAVTAAAPE